MPQHIRGRIHLLAPWIPPSQMSVFGAQVASPPANSLPTSQRILRALPTPILMASAAVMGGVLMEIAREWDDWMKVTGNAANGKNETGRRTLRERASVGGFR